MLICPRFPKSQPSGAWEAGAHRVSALDRYDYEGAGTLLAVASVGSWCSPEAKCLSCEQGFGGFAKSSILGISSLSVALPLEKQPIRPTCLTSPLNFERE